jgi:ATPase family associated with various cellular activities (AAA)
MEIIKPPTLLNFSLSDYSGVIPQYAKEKTFRFIETIEAMDRVAIAHVATVMMSKRDLIAQVSALIGQSQSFVTSAQCAIQGSKVLVEIVYGNLPQRFDRQPSIGQQVIFEVWGSATEAWTIYNQIVEQFPFKVASVEPIITWDLIVDNQHQTRNVKLDRAKPIKPEYYPWLSKDAYAVFDEYMDGDESVLILLGETGTGKTSFIRSLIWHRQVNCRLTYDERLLASDGLFFAFLTDDSTDLMVIEDADVLLMSREKFDNKLMARFLNFTEGLVSVRKKKIIFTANVMDVRKIDQALLRSGRCYDFFDFRRLSFDEACRAADAAGIARLTGRGDETETYTLAEIMKPKNTTRPKVGFAF